MSLYIADSPAIEMDASESVVLGCALRAASWMART
ncbi:Uncharacterised protein [Mycobacteroides abscessus subsp. abscessus]|nr:Uncharacterised protein [Mycobacteroides abscessus subsp. abscessus]